MVAEIAVSFARGTSKGGDQSDKDFGEFMVVRVTYFRRALEKPGVGYWPKNAADYQLEGLSLDDVNSYPFSGKSHHHIHEYSQKTLGIGSGFHLDGSNRFQPGFPSDTLGIRQFVGIAIQWEITRWRI